MRMMGELVMGSGHQMTTRVRVVSDYLVVGKHRLLILIEAPEANNAEAYARPFGQIGSVAVNELDRCEAVMARAMSEMQAAESSE